MCFRVDCKRCRKYLWGGSGKHLANLYACIDEESIACASHGLVVIPKQGTSTEQPSVASASGK